MHKNSSFIPLCDHGKKYWFKYFVVQNIPIICFLLIFGTFPLVIFHCIYWQHCKICRYKSGTRLFDRIMFFWNSIFSFKLHSFKLHSFKLHSFKLHSFKLHSFKLHSFKLHSFKLHSFELFLFITLFQVRVI